MQAWTLTLVTREAGPFSLPTNGPAGLRALPHLHGQRALGGPRRPPAVTPPHSATQAGAGLSRNLHVPDTE